MFYHDSAESPNVFSTACVVVSAARQRASTRRWDRRAATLGGEIAGALRCVPAYALLQSGEGSACPMNRGFSGSTDKQIRLPLDSSLCQHRSAGDAVSYGFSSLTTSAAASHAQKFFSETRAISEDPRREGASLDDATHRGSATREGVFGLSRDQ